MRVLQPMRDLNSNSVHQPSTNIVQLSNALSAHLKPCMTSLEPCVVNLEPCDANLALLAMRDFIYTMRDFPLQSAGS